ncbi:MAG: rod shape-determining protein MreC [Erysipelotrichaceae bacterium]
MSKFNKKQRIIIFIIMLVMGLGFITKTMENRNLLTNIAYDSFMMIKYTLIEKPSNLVHGWFDDFSRLWTALDENDQMKKEMSQQPQFEAAYNESQRALKELEELNKLVSSMTSYSCVQSNVIYRDVNMWNSFITIDKGTKDNIKKDMAVINSKGLIGRISEVGETTSKVKLLTSEDKSNKVSVRIEVNKNQTAEAILENYDSNTSNYLVHLFDNNIDLEAGKTVITSGNGGVFPSGILVGTVSSVEDLNNQIGKTVFVKPAVDYNDFDYVAVINSGGE